MLRVFEKKLDSTSCCLGAQEKKNRNVCGLATVAMGFKIFCNLGIREENILSLKDLILINGCVEKFLNFWFFGHFRIKILIFFAGWARKENFFPQFGN